MSAPAQPPPDTVLESPDWYPKLIGCLRNYNLATFWSDLIAGITVGLVALPLAMAFAIASGMTPQSGLYCAIVAGFISAALGGTRTQVSGPTGAFVVVVAGIVHKHGVEGLYICTLLAGIMLILLGITGLGSAIKFIPRPVVVGFTNGIALLIASTQIKDFFGLKYEHDPGLFMDRILAIIKNFGTVSIPTALLAISSLLIIVLFAKFIRKVPGAIMALGTGTVASLLLHLPVETIQTRFGGIPSGLPQWKVPVFHPELMSVLMAPAVTIAMLGAIESLMSAVVADRMTRDKHNPNVELVAQGVANVFSPMVGGLPSTGAIARTATNIRSGAKTPVAGMIHALVLLAIILFAAPVARFIPLCVLSAILFVVAYNMGEWKEIPQIWRTSRSDVAVWFVTFMLTVFADLTVAVQAGMILAALLYIQKVTSTTTVSQVTDEYVTEGKRHSLQHHDIPDGVAIFRIHGPFLFGSTDKLAEVLDRLPDLPPVVILRLRNMNAIDGTGVQALEELADRLHESGRELLVCGMRDQPKRLLDKYNFHDHVGEENICPDVASALVRAQEVLMNLDDGFVL